MNKPRLQSRIVVPIRVAFFIAMMVLCTHVWGQSTWTGNTDANWNKGANWDTNAVPDANTDVIIPAGRARYPECTEDSECRNIYLAAGARLGKQHLLTYEKAFVDVSIPTNRYVRITPPLKETYSGDFFTKEQGGKWDDEFTAASYEPTEGVGPDSKNRVYPGATYQSVYSEVSAQRGNYGETSVSTLESGWSDPKNALNTLYQPLQALDVWVDNDQKGTATFRFPSKETKYLYFDQHGKAQSFGETTARSDASGKFVYDKGNMELQYWRDAGSEFPLFCIGNPSMAYLDAKAFLKGNEHVTPFIYLHKEENGGRGTETILYYNEALDKLIQVPSVEDGTMPETKDEPIVADDSPLRYVKPTQGFRVMSGGTKIHALEPKLIGGAVNGTYIQREYWKGTNTTPEKKAPQGPQEFTMSISIDPTNPHRVLISNFIGQGNVYAIVNKEDKTLTIPNGTPFGFIDSNWDNRDGEDGYPNHDILYIYGCTEQGSETINGQEYKKIIPSENAILYINPRYGTKYYTKYITNIGADVVFDYEEKDGNIIISQRNPFVTYTKRMYDDIVTQTNTPQNIPSNGNNNCVAWKVYDKIQNNKSYNFTEGFILPNAIGVYKSRITGKVGTISNDEGNVTDNAEYGGIIIQQLQGTYDQVHISGLYPQKPSSVIGTITKNGQTYTLTIASGQIVNQVNVDDPSKNYHLYNTTNRQNAITLTWKKEVDKLFGKWESNSKIGAHITHQNSNPSNTSPGFFLSIITKEANPGIFGIGATPAEYQFWMEQTSTELPDNSDDDLGVNDDIFASQDLNLLTLAFTPGMFVVNPKINPSAAPQRRKVQAKEASSLITITAQGEEYSGSTLLVKSEKGRAGYSSREDAPLSDISEQRFCMASLAGEQVVGVNVFNETDIIPLYIQGEAQKLTLSFGNIEALGWEAELYDAVEESSTDISKGECKIEIQLHGDQPAGRFFIRKKSGGSTPGEATSMEKEKEWAPQAWSPTKGTIVIMSQAADMQAEVMVTNVAGQSVVYEKVSSIHTLRNLLPGVYVVQLRIGNSYWNKKVLVN